MPGKQYAARQSGPPLLCRAWGGGRLPPGGTAGCLAHGQPMGSGGLSGRLRESALPIASPKVILSALYAGEDEIPGRGAPPPDPARGMASSVTRKTLAAAGSPRDPGAGRPLMCRAHAALLHAGVRLPGTPFPAPRRALRAGALLAGPGGQESPDRDPDRRDGSAAVPAGGTGPRDDEGDAPCGSASASGSAMSLLPGTPPGCGRGRRGRSLVSRSGYQDIRQSVDQAISPSGHQSIRPSGRQAVRP
jgi:hypothetical protein